VRSRWPLLLAVGALAALAFASAHVVLEHVARWVETEERGYLWYQEEYLQLFVPTNYVGRGRGRLLLAGPSEAREGFLPERFDARLPGWRAYQNAQSLGALEDLLVTFDYVERAYGAEALPDGLVVGMTPRFLGSLRPVPSPLYDAIDRFSWRYRVDRDASPPRLVPKTPVAALMAWARFLEHQGRRYTAACRGVLRAALRRAGPPGLELAERLRLDVGLTPSKYHHQPRRILERTIAWLDDPQSHWRVIHAWDPVPDRARVLADVGRLRALCERRGIALFVVAFPELSHSLQRYAPGHYEAYLALLREAFADVPRIDLTDLLPDEEFYDASHPTLAGAERITERAAELVAGASAGGSR
jgi:hypothetical protein